MDPSQKRFVLFIGYPPTAEDHHASGLIQTAPGLLKNQIDIYAVTPDLRPTVPAQVQAGTPVLLDRGTQAFAPSGNPTLQTISSLVQQARQEEQAQQAAARQQLMSNVDAWAPPDPTRAQAVPTNPYTTQRAATMTGGTLMSDRAAAIGEVAMDPRSVPGSSMPHASQMGAPFVAQRPMTQAPMPPPDLSAGIGASPGSMSEPSPSTLGPMSTIGGGQGIPGGTMNLGRPGRGLGTDISDASLQTAGVPNSKEHSVAALDDMFGGQKTGYNVATGNMPGYMASMQGRMQGASLQADYSFRDGGVVSSDSVDSVMKQRAAAEQRILASQRGGTITSDSDKGSSSIGGSDVRRLMQQRTSQVMPAPRAGFQPVAITSLNDSIRGPARGDEMGAAMAPAGPMGPMGGMMGGMPPAMTGGGGGMNTGMSDSMSGGMSASYSRDGRPPIGASGVHPSMMAGTQPGMMGMGGMVSAGGPF